MRKVLNRFIIHCSSRIRINIRYLIFCLIQIWNWIEKNTENEFRFINLVSALEIDTNTNIHIISFSGYGIIRILIFIFHPYSICTLYLSMSLSLCLHFSNEKTRKWNSYEEIMSLPKIITSQKNEPGSKKELSSWDLSIKINGSKSPKLTMVLNQARNI